MLALSLNLSESEREAITLGDTDDIAAREAFLRGWELYLRFTPDDNAKAAEQLKIAVELDPDYGHANSALALVYIRGCQWRWHAELGISKYEASVTAQKYLSEGRKSSSSLTSVAASQFYLYVGLHDRSLTEAARAISLDPNDPEAHVAMALAMITTGRPEAGLEFVETALRLNPTHPSHYVLAHGIAYFAMGKLEQAAAILGSALERDPSAIELAPVLAATYAHLGRREDAHAALRQYRPGASQLEMQSIDLTYTFPYDWPADSRKVRDRIIDGIYVAGLPLDITVPVLAETLKHENVKERQFAVETLKRFGPAAVDAVPALIETLSDDKTWVRNDVAIALEKIGPAAEAAIPALVAIQDDASVGYHAKRALKEIRGF